MAKFVRLSPYKTIIETMDAFFRRVHPTIETLALRTDPVYKGHVREINFAKLIKLNDLGCGMINVHILNNKFSTLNTKTNRLKPLFESEFCENVVSPEFFETDFVDEADNLEIRISFTQFESKALALSPVKFSAIYHTQKGDNDAIEKAVKRKECISYLWEDPAMVISTKDFFSLVKPILDAWVPAIEDITGETLFVS